MAEMKSMRDGKYVSLDNQEKKKAINVLKCTLNIKKFNLI